MSATSSSASPAARRLAFWGGWAALVVVASTIAGVWFSAEWGGVRIAVIGDNLLEVLAAATAAFLCYVASRSPAQTRRQVWIMMAWSSALWAVGDLAESAQQVVLGSTPIASLGAPFYVASVPFGIMSILGWRGTDRRALRGLLDGLILGGTLFVLSWSLLLGPVFASAHPALVDKLLDFIYAVSDLVALTVVVFALARWVRPPEGRLVLFSAGLFAHLVADTAYIWMTLRGTYGPANGVDAGWVMGYGLIACAAMGPRPRAAEQRERRRPGLLDSLVPYSGLAAGTAAFGYKQFGGGGVDPVLFGAAFIVITLIMLSQLLAAQENRRWARAQEERVAAQRLREALETMLDSVLLLSPVRDSSGEVSDFRVVYSNLGNAMQSPSSERRLSVTGALLRDLHPEVAERAVPPLLRALTSGTSIELDEVPIPLAPLAIGLDDTHFYDIKAAPCGRDLLVVLRDVTETLDSRRRLEELIREKNAVLDSVGEGIYVVDTEGRCMLVNRAACELLGLTEAELLGVEWHSAVHQTLPSGASCPEESCPIHNTLRTGARHHRLDETFWRADGTPLNVEYSAVPLIQGGRALGAVVVVTDVTERRRADEALRKSQIRGQQAEELAGLGVWTRNLSNGRQLVLSPMARRIMGFGISEEVTEERVMARLDAKQRSLAMRLDAETGEREWQGELRVSLPDGEERWVVTQARLLRNADGRPVALLGAVMDITSAKRNQKRLEAYAIQQGQLADIARQGLSSDDPVPVLKSATRVAARALGGDLAALYRYEGDRMVRLTSFGSPALPREWKIHNSPLTVRLLEADGVVAVDSCCPNEQLSAPLRERGIHSSAAVAIRGRESPYGALFVHSRVRRSHSEADLKWLGSVADVVSVVIERTMVDAELQASVTELTRLDEQRRLLLAHLVKAQEDERHRIAADLHDDVVQLMSAINLRLEVLRSRGGLDADENIDTLQHLVTQSIKRLRELLFELHPPALEEYGLVAALRAQLDQLAEGTGLVVDIRAEITQEPDPSARTVLFRIAQEALQNVRKHAKAGRVAVQLRTVSGGTQVWVRDDGRGLPPGFGSSPPLGHLGLTGMEERARLAGGWWRISRADAGGTLVEFWVPGLVPPALTPGAVAGLAVGSQEPREAEAST